MKKKNCKCKNKEDFNTSYTIPNETMDHTLHNEHYWDTNRNFPPTTFETQLDKITKDITDLLKSKNKAYGNSALEPANIFSKTNATDSLCARIDDKLMRIKNKGINDKTEDTVDDLIGYLLLLKMSM